MGHYSRLNYNFPALIYNGPVTGTARVKTKKQRRRPSFDLVRCKRCSICCHFCPEGAIGLHPDGTPYLLEPEACRACRLCEDMCPDWAICLRSEQAGDAS